MKRPLGMRIALVMLYGFAGIGVMTTTAFAMSLLWWLLL